MNFIIQIIFSILSGFEKYKLVDDENKSKIIKIFIAQFINTGLIILITNIDFNIKDNLNLDFLFGGSYTDLNPEWFKNIGTVISLTLIINIISPILVSLLFTFIRKLSVCIDRGCTSNPYKTH